MKSQTRSMLSSLFVLLLCDIVLAANPVTAPIVNEGFAVYSERFAQLPAFGGAPARIICMVPNGRELYVCTLTRIYKITADRQVSLFLDVASAIQIATDRSLSISNTQHGGVRSIAFHPNYNSNGLLYVSAMESRPSNPKDFNYVSDVQNPIAADSVLLEFRFDSATGRPAPSSYRLLFRVGMPVFDHPIKQIAFSGPFLYIAHGDGSVQSATVGGGQNNDALGKIMRIDPLEREERPYSVPADNPFTASSNMKDEVWATGFRNPHRICFGNDGTLYVSDAGRANVEEVNIVLKGKNYGWSKREGTFVHVGGELLNGVKPLPTNDADFAYEYPAAQVGHEGNPGEGFVGQAIAGGCPIENGSPMSGKYYYVDFPKSGRLYYSGLAELKGATTRGSPGQLSQARTFIATIFFDHDSDPNTPPREYASLGEALRSEPGLENSDRADIRLGRGSGGELYWSSKRSGSVYLFTSSLRG